MSTLHLLRLRDVRGIGAGPKATLVALADLAGIDGECQTTIERLASYRDTDAATVQRDLVALADAGLVDAAERPGGYRFKVHVDRPVDLGVRVAGRAP